MYPSVGLYLTNQQSWARDNTTATTWPCFQAKKVVNYCIMSLFVFTILFKHGVLTIFCFLCCPWCSVRLSHCRYCVVVVAKVKNCCVPSPDIFLLFTSQPSRPLPGSATCWWSTARSSGPSLLWTWTGKGTWLLTQKIVLCWWRFSIFLVFSARWVNDFRKNRYLLIFSIFVNFALWFNDC